MIIPIKCFTCGNVLANKYLFYLEEVSKEKNKNGDTEQLEYLTEANLSKSIEAKVLDKLNLIKPCCRRHMLTHVDVF